jgi:hypothetical protein
LDHIHFLAMMNNAAMDICNRLFCGYLSLSFLGVRLGILELLGDIIFSSGRTILHSHQQCVRVPVFACPHQCWLLSILSDYT